ncbi:MAG TPA: 50S ribosomal protein L11 methyltransferase [Vicinamibacteria bacterium]|nr:50S ribosomal protein L11 methyltransferase [Vicinamibacteria bacterium]
MPPATGVYPVLEVFGEPEALELAAVVVFDGGCLGTELLDDGSGFKAFFGPETRVTTLAEALRRKLRVRVHVPPPFVDRDWLLEWKKGLQGFALGERFYVLPTWLRVPDTGREILRLDPERAFGLGTHDTTRLAVELIERYLEPGQNVIDIGTGSGILAMVAARLGAASVLAVDCDGDACVCARENVSRNGLAGIVRVECRFCEDLPHLESDVVVANINAPVLTRAASQIHAQLVVLSGILLEEANELALALPRRMRDVEMWSAGEWVALVSRSQ